MPAHLREYFSRRPRYARRVDNTFRSASTTKHREPHPPQAIDLRASCFRGHYPPARRSAMPDPENHPAPADRFAIHPDLITHPSRADPGARPVGVHPVAEKPPTSAPRCALEARAGDDRRVTSRVQQNARRPLVWPAVPHEPGAVDLTFFGGGRAAPCTNHDTSGANRRRGSARGP